MCDCFFFFFFWVSVQDVFGHRFHVLHADFLRFPMCRHGHGQHHVAGRINWLAWLCNHDLHIANL